MIITNIIGGLGNQLFQYACARGLAHHINCDFKLDITGFKDYRLHKYSLFHFNIDENIASEQEILKLKAPNKRRGKKWYQKLNTTLNIKKIRHFVEEYPYCYDKRVKKLTSPVYIEGYWNSFLYFTHFRDSLLDEISVKEAQIGRDLEIANHVAGTNSVSLHIRRGDYATNKKTLQKHGVMSLSYYNKAVELIAENVQKPVFFIFSDDPQWVRDNFNLGFEVVYVDHNGPEKNYEDLRLMSQCKNNIIANSTFSWWGGWLNRNENKIVIAPKKWMNYKIKINDLLPKSWELI